MEQRLPRFKYGDRYGQDGPSPRDIRYLAGLPCAACTGLPVLLVGLKSLKKSLP